MLQETPTLNGKFTEVRGVIDTEEELRRVASILGTRVLVGHHTRRLPQSAYTLVNLSETVSGVVGITIGTYVSIYFDPTERSTESGDTVLRSTDTGPVDG